jgi:hypothetical protein
MGTEVQKSEKIAIKEKNYGCMEQIYSLPPTLTPSFSVCLDTTRNLSSGVLPKMFYLFFQFTTGMLHDRTISCSLLCSQWNYFANGVSFHYESFSHFTARRLGLSFTMTEQVWQTRTHLHARTQVSSRALIKQYLNLQFYKLLLMNFDSRKED